MARQTGGALLSIIEISRDSRVPYYRQLEDALRRMIINGELTTGQRLPATRELCKDLGISRLTVKNVYEQLVAERFLESRPGAGTFVADISPNEQLPAVDTPASVERGRQHLSHRAVRIGQSKAVVRLDGHRPFRPGVPALDMFPRNIWASKHSKVLRNSPIAALGYGTPGGHPALKRAIASHVQDHRGVNVDPEQIIITAGAQQAFVLIAFALLNPGDVVWSEDPGHIAGRDAMRTFGAEVKSVAIDEEGFDLAAAQAEYPAARLIYVTPSHQHPLGVTMSLNRRMALLDYAHQQQAWIVEDDYDSEFRYRGRPLPAMQSFDRDGRVLYVGSFSKTLFPALRLGYLISPPAFVETFSAGQTLLSQNVSPIAQETLAHFIEDGSYNAHIRKMRALYTQRLEHLTASLQREADDIFRIRKPDAGMHLVAWLRDKQLDDGKVCETIWRQNVDCLPVSIYCDKRRIDPGIMLGFACAPESEIDQNVRLLSEAIRGS